MKGPRIFSAFSKRKSASALLPHAPISLQMRCLPYPETSRIAIAQQCRLSGAPSEVYRLRRGRAFQAYQNVRQGQLRFPRRHAKSRGRTKIAEDRFLFFLESHGLNSRRIFPRSARAEQYRPRWGKKDPPDPRQGPLPEADPRSSGQGRKYRTRPLKQNGKTSPAARENTLDR